jgi:hypothetical protein
MGHPIHSLRLRFSIAKDSLDSMEAEARKLLSEYEIEKMQVVCRSAEDAWRALSIAAEREMKREREAASVRSMIHEVK